MDRMSSCFDSFAKGSVSGFAISGLLSLVVARKPSRFRFMMFGTGIGAGYGAFDCDKEFMHFAVNDYSKEYLGFDFASLLNNEGEAKAPEQAAAEEPKEVEVAKS